MQLFSAGAAGGTHDGSSLASMTPRAPFASPPGVGFSHGESPSRLLEAYCRKPFRESDMLLRSSSR